MSAQSIDNTKYFRVWQGFRRTDLTPPQFLESIADFMKLTVDLYRGRALNNYIVSIPPAVKPSCIPDELALVALSSKDTYEQIRATPEGQAYSAKHWEVFDRQNSKSAPLVDFTAVNPQSLENQTAYDMIGTPNNWAVGYTAVSIGTKRNGTSSENFLLHLYNHAKQAKAAMVPEGLKGYIFIANENYVVAYLNWESKEAHNAAGATEEGKRLFAEAKQFMDVLMYQEAVTFSAGSVVNSGESYSTLQR